MDNLVDLMQGSFDVSTEPNSTFKPHPRFSQYKSSPIGAPDQEERRQRFLEAQKKRKLNYLDHVRRLAENYWDDYQDDNQEASDVAADAPLDLSVGKKSDEKADTSLSDSSVVLLPGRHYRNQLMMNEWMLEQPADLAENYIMVLCPLGKRTLVVATQGSTCAYDRSGRLLDMFPSSLPGGYKWASGMGRSGSTVLDCIYVDKERTFYCLDLICWNESSFTDTETECRLFWLQSKIAENPELAEKSRKNPFRFLFLSNYPADRQTISDILTGSIPFEMDGILFFHKLARYLFGTTPLVLWVKPFMVPDLLHIAVPDSLLKDKPTWYTGFESHLQMLHTKEERRRAANERRAQLAAGGEANSSEQPMSTEQAAVEAPAASCCVGPAQ